MQERWPSFLESDVPPAPPESAQFHIVPVPLEASVSYGHGAAEGPRAILSASLQLEAFDGHGVPAEAGIHTQPPVRCDAADAEDVLKRTEARVGGVLDGGAIPVVLGGEHTVTVGAVRAAVKRVAGLGVVQFDAHADLRDTYEDSPLSHACVMRRLAELGVPIFQIGVRSLSSGEAAFRREHAIPHLDAESLARGGIPEAVLPPRFPECIYITFDLDALDPAVIPHTGTPEPGGLSWYDALDLLHKVIAGRRVIGMDFVELAPVAGSIVSPFAAAKLVYTAMGIVNRDSALGTGRVAGGRA